MFIFNFLIFWYLKTVIMIYCMSLKLPNFLVFLFSFNVCHIF